MLTTSFGIFWSASADVADLLPNGWPGQPGNVSFGQYAGYVQLPGTKKYFYYAFVEAEVNATKKPLVIWLNGGPGCSSLGAGFFAENGPWRLKNSSGNALSRNPYAWNKEANMLYVESPAGVGFSFSKNSADYKTDDRVTSFDNYNFILGWFAKFPSYKKRALYLSGESYAGHYVPQLAKQIIDRNKYPSSFNIKAKIKFKGVIIGNPYMDEFNDGFGTNFAIDSFFQGSYIYFNVDTFDPYNYFGPVCSYKGADIGLKSNQRGSILYHDSLLDKTREILKGKAKEKEVRSTGAPMSKVGKPAPSTVPKPFSVNNPKCQDFWIYKYLNTPSVRQAIHATSSSRKWFTCASYGNCPDPSQCRDNLSYSRDVDSTVKILKYLIKENLQVWLYSGDTDMVVPFYGTRLNIESLNITLKTSDYIPWYYYDQPAGWIGDYHGLTAATVRGAGHFVPYDKPEVSLYLFKQFLAKKSLPQTSFEFDNTVAYP